MIMANGSECGFYQSWITGQYKSGKREFCEGQAATEAPPL